MSKIWKRNLKTQNAPEKLFVAIYRTGGGQEWKKVDLGELEGAMATQEGFITNKMKENPPKSI